MSIFRVLVFLFLASFLYGCGSGSIKPTIGVYPSTEDLNSIERKPLLVGLYLSPNRSDYAKPLFSGNRCRTTLNFGRSIEKFGTEYYEIPYQKVIPITDKSQFKYFDIIFVLSPELAGDGKWGSNTVDLQVHLLTTLLDAQGKELWTNTALQTGHANLRVAGCATDHTKISGAIHKAFINALVSSILAAEQDLALQKTLSAIVSNSNRNRANTQLLAKLNSAPSLTQYRSESWGAIDGLGVNLGGEVSSNTGGVGVLMEGNAVGARAAQQYPSEITDNNQSVVHNVKSIPKEHASISLNESSGDERPVLTATRTKANVAIQSKYRSLDKPYIKQNIACKPHPEKKGRMLCSWGAIEFQTEGTYTLRGTPGTLRTPDNYKRALIPTYKNEESYWAEQETEDKKSLKFDVSGTFYKEKAEECRRAIEEVERELQEYTDMVERQECDDDVGYSREDDTVVEAEYQSLDYQIRKMQQARNTHNRGFWLRHVKACIKDFNKSKAFDIYRFNRTLKYEYRECGKEGASLFNDMIITMNDVNDHLQEDLELAERTVAAAENRSYNQKKSQEREHQQRLNNSFKQWASDFRTSNQRTVEQLDQVYQRTNNAYQSMRDNYRKEAERRKRDRQQNADQIIQSFSSNQNIDPDIVKKAKEKYLADKLVSDKKKAIQKKIDENKKLQREREIQMEIEQRKRDREAERLQREADGLQRELDREADRERRCITILAKDPYDCQCIDLGPKAGANHCTK